MTASHIRAAMFGTATPDVRIVRQAWRVDDSDSDELALMCVRDRSWWVAQRCSERLLVWAFVGVDEAEDGFERMLSEDAARGRSWREAAPTTLAG